MLAATVVTVLGFGLASCQFNAGVLQQSLNGSGDSYPNIVATVMQSGLPSGVAALPCAGASGGNFSIGMPPPPPLEFYAGYASWNGSNGLPAGKYNVTFLLGGLPPGASNPFGVPVNYYNDGNFVAAGFWNFTHAIITADKYNATSPNLFFSGVKMPEKLSLPNSIGNFSASYQAGGFVNGSSMGLPPCGVFYLNASYPGNGSTVDWKPEGGLPLNVTATVVSSSGDGIQPQKIEINVRGIKISMVMGGGGVKSGGNQGRGRQSGGLGCGQGGNGSFPGGGPPMNGSLSSGMPALNNATGGNGQGCQPSPAVSTSMDAASGGSITQDNVAGVVLQGSLPKEAVDRFIQNFTANVKENAQKIQVKVQAAPVNNRKGDDEVGGDFVRNSASGTLLISHRGVERIAANLFSNATEIISPANRTIIDQKANAKGMQSDGQTMTGGAASSRGGAGGQGVIPKGNSG